ncbi:hypothetical protein [Novosphingobium sp. BL-52-GroH]|uniref:hypothetical protein n=1 Tax=Novosphingobium sp. BL-52-GroH TaxID=3349877 RepID=UPI00384D9798
MFFYRSHLSAAVSPSLLRKARSTAGSVERKRPVEKRIFGTLSIGRRCGEVEE